MAIVLRVEPETAAILRNLGRRIGELRRERGITQETAAEMIGMLAPNYSRIEQGRQNVTVDTLVRIARMLGPDVTVAELFAPPVTPGRRRRKHPGVDT